MENNKTWVLIADASSARIFALYKALIFKDPNNTKNFELISQFNHADSRKKGIELMSDRTGNFGSGTFVDPTDPKFYQAEQFAHELLEYLEISRGENKFRDLILVSPPAFMGLLNKHMHHNMHKLVTQTIEKDYTKQHGRELIQSLLSHW